MQKKKKNGRRATGPAGESIPVVVLKGFGRLAAKGAVELLDCVFVTTGERAAAAAKREEDEAFEARYREAIGLRCRAGSRTTETLGRSRRT